MDIASKKLVIFDVDGTLAPSKSRMSKEMGELIVRLLATKKVAIISGGGFPQLQMQFIAALPHTSESFTNLFLLPTSGTRMYVWKKDWTEQYSEQLLPKERERVINALNVALKTIGYIQPQQVYGQIIEDRGSQITFSALGQQAPLEKKEAWQAADRAGGGPSKREKIVSILKNKIPEFDARIGGTTSIDITKRGVNKAYGIRKLEEILKLSPDEIVFVGDALFHGGNDYPARATGVDCIQVSGPDDTARQVREWLK